MRPLRPQEEDVLPQPTVAHKLDCGIMSMVFEKHCGTKPSDELLKSCGTKDYFLPELTLEANDKCKKSSLPFISIDLFREHADIIISNEKDIRSLEVELDEKCNKRKEDDGACLIFFGLRDIYCPIYGAGFLLRWLNKPFSLISTQNDDECIPFYEHPREAFGKNHSDVDLLLQSPLLRHWYMKNVCVHPEHFERHFVPVPIGPKWNWYSTAFNGEDKIPVKQRIIDGGAGDPKGLFASSNKTRSIYVALNTGTTDHPLQHSHKNLRNGAMNVITSTFPDHPTDNPKEFYRVHENVDHGSFMKHLATQGMVLSPPGKRLSIRELKVY